MPDEKGMYLLVHQNGSKYFRLDYRFDGKRKTLALGVYPDTSLKQAREKRDTAKKQIADGIDPSENKKAVKSSKAESAANSFEVIAREWVSKKVETWAEKNNRSKRMLERNIFPWLGRKDIVKNKGMTVQAPRNFDMPLFVPSKVELLSNLVFKAKSSGNPVGGF